MNGTQTLGRALDILFVLAESKSTLTVPEIAEQVSIPESTAYRLLQTLEKNGIIERRGKGQIGLGLRILDLARSLQRQIDQELYVIALPIMEKLTEITNETSVLMVRTGVNGICIQNVESSRLIRFAIENGRILPLHSGASGKAILAFESQTVKEKILEVVPSEYERRHIREELEQINELGYSTTIGEVDQDVAGIAFPIFDPQNRVIASLTIAGPSERFNDEAVDSIVSVLRDAVNEISNKLKQVEKFD